MRFEFLKGRCLRIICMHGKDIVGRSAILSFLWLYLTFRRVTSLVSGYLISLVGPKILGID